MNTLHAPCTNCGKSTPVAAMLRDPDDGTFRCVDCPDEGWLRRFYGDAAAAQLIALREGGADSPTLAELVARYPERAGSPKLPHCPQGHPFTEENTYRRRDGRRACRACIAAYRVRRKVAA